MFKKILSFKFHLKKIKLFQWRYLIGLGLFGILTTLFMNADIVGNTNTIVEDKRTFAELLPESAAYRQKIIDLRQSLYSQATTRASSLVKSGFPTNAEIDLEFKKLVVETVTKSPGSIESLFTGFNTILKKELIANGYNVDVFNKGQFSVSDSFAASETILFRATETSNLGSVDPSKSRFFKMLVSSDSKGYGKLAINAWDNFLYEGFVGKYSVAGNYGTVNPLIDDMTFFDIAPGSSRPMPSTFFHEIAIHGGTARDLRNGVPNDFHFQVLNSEIGQLPPLYKNGFAGDEIRAYSYNAKAVLLHASMETPAQPINAITDRAISTYTEHIVRFSLEADALARRAGQMTDAEILANTNKIPSIHNAPKGSAITVPGEGGKVAGLVLLADVPVSANPQVIVDRFRHQALTISEIAQAQLADAKFMVDEMIVAPRSDLSGLKGLQDTQSWMNRAVADFRIKESQLGLQPVNKAAFSGTYDEFYYSAMKTGEQGLQRLFFENPGMIDSLFDNNALDRYIISNDGSPMPDAQKELFTQSLRDSVSGTSISPEKARTAYLTTQSFQNSVGNAGTAIAVVGESAAAIMDGVAIWNNSGNAKGELTAFFKKKISQLQGVATGGAAIILVLGGIAFVTGVPFLALAGTFGVIAIPYAFWSTSGSLANAFSNLRTSFNAKTYQLGPVNPVGLGSLASGADESTKLAARMAFEYSDSRNKALSVNGMTGNYVDFSNSASSFAGAAVNPNVIKIPKEDSASGGGMGSFENAWMPTIRSSDILKDSENLLDQIPVSDSLIQPADTSNQTKVVWNYPGTWMRTTDSNGKDTGWFWRPASEFDANARATVLRQAQAKYGYNVEINWGAGVPHPKPPDTDSGNNTNLIPKNGYVTAPEVPDYVEVSQPVLNSADSLLNNGSTGAASTFPPIQYGEELQ